LDILTEPVVYRAVLGFRDLFIAHVALIPGMTTPQPTRRSLQISAEWADRLASGVDRGALGRRDISQARIAFSLHTSNFGKYNQTYGSLGAIVVVMPDS